MRIIVTGAARGIGAAVAERQAAAGGSVVLVDRAPAVEATASDVGRRLQAEARLCHIVGDTTDPATVEAACTLAQDQFGGIDGLVNNAGIPGPHALALDTTSAAFREVIEVNLIGYFLFAQAVGRALVQAGTPGAIVNVGSWYGQEAATHCIGYCSAKGGVAILSQALALELAPHRIRVNTVAPGNVGTEMHWAGLREVAAQNGTTFEAEVERQARSVPLGWIASPEEVADAVGWLLSDRASYVTGQTIGVNGGVYLT